MKIRSFLIIALLSFTLTGNSQPVETTYLGTVIKSGYSDEESFGPFNIGFNFTFFGNIYSQFYVNSNGLVLFGAGSTDGTEDSIPTAAAPNNFIAPLWDDLIISSSGKMLYTTIGTAPNRKLIIQGTNMGFYPYPIFMGTYLVILYETSNKIQVQYRIIIDATSTRAHGASATIGIENSTGLAGVQYAYHKPAAISTGKAISFTPSGSTYTMNADAMYDGVVLTTNLTLPEPGIPQLLSPPQNAVIGSDYTFEWAESGNSASYTLLISHFSDIGGATAYNPGTNLSYNVTGLTLDTAYYWGVFATNATGTTWCEIQKFRTSSVPPLAAVPRTLWVEQSQEKIIKLDYTGGDAGTKKAIITSLPVHGQLFQYNAGVKGAQITTVPDTVTDAGRNVIYLANGSTGNGAGNFSYKIHDNSGTSADAQITVNVSPPGIPNLLYTAKNTTYLEFQFDRIMANPAGKQGQFAVTVNSLPATLSSLALKAGDPYTIVATLASPILLTDAVTVSYTAGDVASAQGGWLASFTAQTISLKAQTITFNALPSKKYGDVPFTLSATTTSGQPITFSSSNLTVATIVTSTLTIRSVGSSDITARQAGNGTWAPARYDRTLTVAKGDQTITFSTLPVKTYGDINFTVTATATSGLSVGIVSGNPSVATIAVNTVHIAGAGTSVFTASQPGNALWNPAPDVQQTLTVNKANQTITFNVLSIKTFGDPDYSISAVASSGFTVDFVSNNTSVATVTGNTVHIVGAGTTLITASQSGDGNYNAAPDVPRTLTVNKASQTITFNILSDRTFGDPDYSISAGASSGLSVVFASSNSAVATIAGNTVHITGAGTTLITASQPGDGNYNAAPDVPQTLTVNKANQTITFSVLSGKTFGDGDYAISAIAGSGLSVSFISSDISVATVTGNIVHIVAPGTTIITASQGGDSNYNPAPDVPQTLTVNKADQTITFSVLSDKTYGDGDFAISAIAGSGLSVNFVSSNTSVATVTGTTVHIAGAGTTIITASQGGDSYYNPAPDVPQTLTVNKADQTITFSVLSDKNFGDPDYSINATASSGFNVSFASSNSAVATVAGNIVHIAGAGTTVITASQSGDANYNPAPDVPQTLIVLKLAQTITFTDSPDSLLARDTFTLAATSSAGLPVLFESSDEAIATVSGNQVTGIVKGTVQIHAFNSGDENYEAAEAFADIEVYSTHKDIMYLFTPNNDGINDLWELPELSAWGACDVKVYNRWGKLVYANKNYNNEWPGVSEGRPLPEGAYYFVIKTENAGIIKGTLNLVR